MTILCLHPKIKIPGLAHALCETPKPCRQICWSTDMHYFAKENSSEYLYEFNYGDFRIVKKECCEDERNTYWVCSNEFFELASILTEENDLFEPNSPEESLLLLQELYQIILHI